MEIKKKPPPLLVANRKPADKRALLCHSPSCAGSPFRPQDWQGQRLCQLRQLHGARGKRGEEEEGRGGRGRGGRAQFHAHKWNGQQGTPQQTFTYPRRKNMEQGTPYSARKQLECPGGGTTDRWMS